jgi:branched-chain amino acid transport system substrate-binding protein
LSGPIGAVLIDNVQGAQVWIKYVNQRGGLNGHEVRGIVYDDGGDPARHLSQAKDAVEHRHVVAFLAMVGALTGKASAEYIASKRVPVVGGDGTEFLLLTPMHFPQTSTFPHTHYSILPALKVMAPGEKKVGTLVCTEAQVCADADRIWSGQTAPEGFEQVYRGKASVAQPDFTAECLSARNAGAEIIVMAMDPNSIQRIAASCARQGYRPRFAALSSVVFDRLKDDPNLEGFSASLQVFPYFQRGTPATDEFQTAMKAFAPGSTINAGQPLGWVAGKLLEKAAAAMPEPPTSEAILEGLWALKGESLGGLTRPLTFVRDKPAPPSNCWFNVTLRNRAWVSPDQYRLNCRPVTGS